MPRTLVLLRHAQAVGHHPQGDKSRTLTVAGRVQAREAGRQIERFNVQLTLCSTASRARETYEQLGVGGRVEYLNALYDAWPHTIASRIGEIDDLVSSLLVVAHAPGLPGLASELAWATRPTSGAHRDVDALLCRFPTAGWLAFGIDAGWSQLASEIIDRGPLAPGDLPITLLGGTAL